MLKLIILAAVTTLASPVPLDRVTARAELAAARARNLEAFRAYVRHGVFPSNTYRTGELNVWRDRDGHLCAAATILAASDGALVARIAKDDNFIKLADVNDGPVMDWILRSGFTQDELVAIQKPFRPVARAPEHAVEPDLRTAEDARLRAKYAAVDRQLVADTDRSLDLAVDRLLGR